MKIKDSENMYPNLATVNEGVTDGDAHNFRLAQIRDIRDFLGKRKPNQR